MVACFSIMPMICNGPPLYLVCSFKCEFPFYDGMCYPDAHKSFTQSYPAVISLVIAVSRPLHLHFIHWFPIFHLYAHVSSLVRHPFFWKGPALINPSLYSPGPFQGTTSQLLWSFMIRVSILLSENDFFRDQLFFVNSISIPTYMLWESTCLMKYFGCHLCISYIVD